MVHKRCHENGCKEGAKENPRCDHGWYLHGEHTPRDGHRFVERGPMKHYLWLAPAGTQLPENRTQAEDLEKLIYAWMIAGRPPKPTTPQPTPPAGDGEKLHLVKHVATDYLERHLKNSGDKNEPSCTNRIIRELGERPMGDLLKQRVLEDYLDDVREDKESVASRNRAFSRLSNLVNYCRREFALEGTSPFYHQTLNPQGVRKLDEHHRRRGEFRAGEEAKLVAAMLKLNDGGLMLGRFYCATDCGPRRGEMLALRGVGAGRDAGIIQTPGKGLGWSLCFRWHTTKTKKSREVPITTERVLKFVLARKDLDFPFGNLDGSRCDSFRIEWENVLLSSKLETGHWTENHTWVRDRDADLHWHDLRHVFATRLLLRGIKGGIARISKLLGHADIQTTMLYLNVGDDDAADAMLEVNAAAGLAKKPKKGKARLRLVS